jgi:predicted RNA-binding Zn ribbon-like protein
MDHKERAAGNLELVGGRLCLDFANTVSTRSPAQAGRSPAQAGRTQQPRREYLASYPDLVEWSHHAGLLGQAEADAMLEGAAHHPELAAAALEQAIALRETVYRIFAALAAGQAPQAADLAAINHALHIALSHLEVFPSPDGFAWRWAAHPGNLEHMLWPIARSAADLLTSSERSRVSRCARAGCDWLFVDLSKNRTRRWCSMGACGSRVKMRRYYRRRKESTLRRG